MEIEKNQGVQIDAYVNQVQDKNKVDSSENNSNKAAAKTDTVVISDAAKRIQEVRSQLDAVPDVDEEKVAQLKKQIEDGTYERSADEIAGKMIREGLINEGLK
ncbi:MAG: flagellar biosynthesis anti-sigma factor FlgM [Desulfobacterales bacterium]|nr:flagellar biosynthesis anti-sigma factor FlgM [Desulfobacterales bacterium]